MPKKKKFFCVMYRDESNVFKNMSQVELFKQENPDFDGAIKEFESQEVAELWGELQEEKSMRVPLPEPSKEFDEPKISKTFKEIAKLYRLSPNLSARKMGVCYDKLSVLFSQ